MGSSSARSSGSSSGSQPQDRRTGSQKGWGNGVEQQSSRDGCVQERASRAVECRAGKEQRRHGCAAEPPSSTSEACGGQEDVLQLTCFARRPAGYCEMDCQKDGGQRRRALFSSSLMCAEPIRCWSAESQLATRCAERVEMRCGRVWASHGGPGRVWDR